LPGHGHSVPVEPYTLDEIVARVDRSFAREHERLNLLGWSLGGLVAMRWARQRGDGIARLALMATSPLFVRRSDWPHAMDAETLARFGDELRTNYRATLLRFLTLQVKNSEQGKASLVALRARLFERGEPSRKTLQQGLDLLVHTDLRADAASLTQPAVVIAGERDTLAPAAAGEWLAQQMAHANLELVTGAGHAPFMSHPRQVLAALDALFAS
jgi:pimeloyl-[acyl-carrier protein] methyl ester esterase